MKKTILILILCFFVLVITNCGGGGGGDSSVSASGRWSGSARFTARGGTAFSSISANLTGTGTFIEENETVTFHFEVEGSVDGTSFEGVINDGFGQSFGFTGSLMDNSVLIEGNTASGMFALEGTVSQGTMTLSGNYFVEGTPGILSADLSGSLDEDSAEECEKVTICHIPPGNPNNCHTITICIDDVGDHLAHGDYIGSCDGPCGDADSESKNKGNKGKAKGQNK